MRKYSLTLTWIKPGPFLQNLQDMQHVLPLMERDDPACIHADRQGGSQIVTRQLEAVTTKAGTFVYSVAF